MKVALLVLALFPLSLFAATEITVSGADLAAFVHLIKPDRTSLALDGRSGEFNPGPALHFIGIENQKFDVNLNLGGRLVDLRFNQIRSKSFNLTLSGDRACLEISLQDQPKAIRSFLGSISIQDVILRAYLSFSDRGSTRLVYERGEIVGTLRGSGLLKSSRVIEGVRKIAMQSLEKQVIRQLARDRVQEAITMGLLNWAKISSDRTLEEIVPGSLKIVLGDLTFTAE